MIALFDEKSTTNLEQGIAQLEVKRYADGLQRTPHTPLVTRQ